MSNKRPPDFTKDEVRLIAATLKERYGHSIEVEQADAEIRLNPAIPELTECPIVFWEVDKCHLFSSLKVMKISHKDKKITQR